ncbi:MAG: DNA polymerase III subunit gamma/tau [Bacteroidetes bacterium]|nr:DNA polymerase III subunit gamma/tau [Bacteroidota bacterium]
MAEYIVSARKYRPTKFKEMVGQEQVATTLKNAIRTGHLAHSFLFCGPRGVGKTTAARILAKTINCENQTDDFEACGQCPSCVAFQQNSSFNIHELDAASNNSVDDIRALVDQVRFPPQTGKYKIYIIDEVHMLSAGAFNAFLKTLEEPPSYCKFILATTEKHKILPTILSRCQIFDFRRIGVDTIVKHLQNICEVEKIDAEEDALHIVAQKADGGMRDALSMFDRLSSFSGGKLTYASVLENLNVLDYDYHFKVTDALISENLSLVLQLFDQVLKKGFEGDDFILGLCEHFRNLLFCKDPNTLKLMEVSENLKQRYAQQSTLALPDFLVNCLSIGNQCDIQYKASKNKRLTVELALIKMCYVNSVVSIDAQEGSKKKLKSLTNEPKNTLQKQEVDTEDTQKAAAPVQAAPPPVNRNVQPIAGAIKTKKVLKIDMLQDALDNPEATDTPILTSDEPEVTYDEPVMILNQDNLAIIWQQYAERRLPEKGGLRVHFSSFSPRLNADMGIDVFVHSQTQKEQFESVKLGVQSYIAQRVGAEVKLNVISDKKTENTRKPYTEKEKFERLVEKNPIIKKLQQEFGLELDYQ